MRDMTSFYQNQSIHDLNVLRSNKYNRLTRLQREPATYLNMQERKKLQTQINWIDAELQCRADQLGFNW